VAVLDRHDDAFPTLAAIRPPRVMVAVAWILLAASIAVAVFLVTVPWVQTTSGPGVVTALNPNDRMQEIDTLVSGRIQEWFVRDGSEVRTGDPIVRIVDNDPQLLERLQAERGQVAARLDAAEAAARTAEIDLRRTQELFEGGLAASREVEQARIRFEERRAAVADAAAALSRVDVSLSRQSVQVVRAPRDGVILRVDAGDTATVVDAGQRVATFVPAGVERAVELFVDGRDVALVRPGAAVRLQFEGWPAVQFSGWPSIAVGTFDAEVVAWPVRPGLTSVSCASGPGRAAGSCSRPCPSATNSGASSTTSRRTIRWAAAPGARAPVPVSVAGAEVRRGPVLLLLGALLAGASATAREAGTGDVLAPREVLRASAQRFPSILAALARLDAAEGEAQAARGAFDLVFSADSRHRLSGFYDGQVIEGRAERRLRPLGATVYGGYRISEGDFPIYEDKSFTNRGGQATVGVLFSLLRDREVDAARIGERTADLAVREATLDALLVRIGVQQRALGAYWRWVAAGHQLEVYEALLAIAEARASGLEEQVAQGARARIQLVENRQNITRRRILVAEARRDFRMASNALGFYLRDAAGRPTDPGTRRLPAALEAATDTTVPAADLVVGRTLSRRPELEGLRNAVERTRARIELKENALKPRLDLGVELAHGLGGVGEGGESRDSTDTIVGLTFSVPLQQRGARGELAAARAELDALGDERRLLQDRIELEVRNVLLELETARELLALAEVDVDQSQRLVEAERRRFESGASDFFLLNLREEAVADARVRYQEALLAARLARTDYDAATVDVVRLGLDVAPEVDAGP
jgi:outer membrane protein TolC